MPKCSVHAVLLDEVSALKLALDLASKNSCHYSAAVLADILERTEENAQEHACSECE